MKTLPFALGLAAVLLSACSAESEPVRTGQTPPKPRPHLVEVATSASKPVSISVERLGTLTAKRKVKILSREEGLIEELPYFEGDAVKQGTTVLRLDDDLLRAELKKAGANRRQAESDLARMERLHKDRLIPEEELTRARTALDVANAEEGLLKTRLGHTSVKAPFAGLITERLAETGDAVPRYTHVLTLIDPGSLVTTVEVSELLLSELAVGDPVEVRIDALGPGSHEGRISRIHPGVDPATRLGTLEVELTTPPAGARPGQLCRVELRGRPVSRQTIPFAALRRDNDGAFVYSLAEGRAVRTAVRAGAQLGEEIEILGGLNEGTQVITKGFLGLSAGRAVTVAAGAAEEQRP